MVKKIHQNIFNKLLLILAIIFALWIIFSTVRKYLFKEGARANDGANALLRATKDTITDNPVIIKASSIILAIDPSS